MPLGPSIQQFADHLLSDLGLPVSSNNVISIEGWAAGEGGGTSAQSPYVAYNNPLNTTYQLSGSSGFAPGSAIQSYSTPGQGVEATAKTLASGLYSSIVGDLSSSAPPSTTWAAIDSSPWGTQDLGNMSKGGAIGYGATPLEEPASGTTMSTTSQPTWWDPAGNVGPSIGSAVGGAGSIVDKGLGSAIAGGIESGIVSVIGPKIHPIILGVFAVILVLVGLWIATGQRGRADSEEIVEAAA